VKVALESPEQFIADYAGQIVRLVEDAELRAKLGETAREHVERHHDWRTIQTELAAIFEEAFPGCATGTNRVPCPAPLAATA
jgi:glycosyltransferase involved in cell wall biosynthesis